MKTNTNNKRIITIIGFITLIIIVALFIVIWNSGSKKENNSNKSQDEIKNELVKLGKNYYDEILYPVAKDSEDYLPAYVNKGIKNTLTSLKDVVTFSEDLTKTLKDNECNYDNTKIVIYPNEPFGTNDYKVEVELDCKK